MADFEYAFASAGTPNSFALGDTAITGIDEAGTLTPVVVQLAPGVVVLHATTLTQAELAAHMLAYLQGRSYGRETGGGLAVANADRQLPPALTAVPAAD